MWWPFSGAQEEPKKSADASACPVDHTAWSKAMPKSQEADASSSVAACPVDHSAWSKAMPSLTHPNSASLPALSEHRQVSSIPRLSSEAPYNASPEGHSPPESSADADNWVYPSERQFHEALMRKHNKSAPYDMKVVVPIHNAVNEQAWAQLKAWERFALGAAPGEEVPTKLVSFIGRPQDLSPRARLMSLVGYAKPFDRHDWIVDRNGTRVRYVLDFYTGKRLSADQPPAFFIDCRPALDDMDSVYLRWRRWWS